MEAAASFRYRTGTDCMAHAHAPQQVYAVLGRFHGGPVKAMSVSQLPSVPHLTSRSTRQGCLASP